MQILKASFFKAGSHEIRPVTCAKITNDYVFFSRKGRESQNTHSAHKHEKRQSISTRYCETEAEAKRFIESRYQAAINSFKREIEAHEAGVSELLQSITLEAA